MAIVTYATYVPDVAAFVPGCPSLTIVDALRKTAATFFYKSLAYRVWVTPFDLTINTTTYSISAKAPAQTEIAQVLELRCQGSTVEERTDAEFIALDPNWPTLTGTNAQYFTLLENKDSLNIIPKPGATIASALTMRIAVCPTLDSTGVEQVYFEEWKDNIIDGALSRLMRMPGTTWTDPKEALARHEWYNSGVNAAKAQAVKGNTRRNVTVQMRRWV